MTKITRFSVVILGSLLGLALLWSLTAGGLAAQSGPSLSPGESQSTLAGQRLTFQHLATNTLSTADIWQIEARSQRGWLETLQAQTGAGSGSLVLTGSLGSLYLTDTLSLSLTVAPGQAVPLSLGVFPPPNTPGNTTEVITLSLRSQALPTLTVTAINTALVESPTYYVYLPLIQRSSPPRIKFGVDFAFGERFTDVLELSAPLVKEMGADWVRYWVSWSAVETEPGVYDWTRVDEAINRFDELGFEILVVMYGQPLWAADFFPPDSPAPELCGPIWAEDRFDSFMETLVTRYEVQVDAWEFINEPDGLAEFEGWGPLVGCWGDYGAHYAQMMARFYNHVQAFDPSAEVLMGGLAYDNWAHFNRDFFADVTAEMARQPGDYFDVANFHYYPINPVDFPTINHKISALRATMDNQNLPRKPFWVTETSGWVNLGMSLQFQQDYILKTLSRAYCDGVDNIFWFEVIKRPIDKLDLARWLIDEHHQPTNAYYTYQHYATLVADTRCAGAYSAVPAEVEAYRFEGRTHQAYVLWTASTTQTVQIPAEAATLTDRNGDTLTRLQVSGGQASFTVGPDPVLLYVPLGQGRVRLP
jgi:hypothetical protein